MGDGWGEAEALGNWLETSYAGRNLPDNAGKIPHIRLLDWSEEASLDKQVAAAARMKPREPLSVCGSIKKTVYLDGKTWAEAIADAAPTDGNYGYFVDTAGANTFPERVALIHGMMTDSQPHITLVYTGILTEAQ